MPRAALQVASVAFALLAGWVVPALGLKMIMPALEASAPRVRNYRGAEIVTGLGVVWLLWALAVAALDILLFWYGHWTAGLSMSAPPAASLAPTSLEYALAATPALLVVGAFAFGLVDDVFGAADAKGFRGHLSAMRKGRLTTGGLKMLGIGMLAATVAIQAAQAVDRGPAGELPWWFLAGRWVCATLVIALAANLINLTDLRPGRALKAYSALAVIGIATMTWRFAQMWALRFDAAGTVVAGGWDIAVYAACLAALVLGPVAATWRYDLGERGMLGDAGANAAGAFAGYLLAASLDIWWLVVAALSLLALNLASERISFTRIIEGNAALRRIDGIGRIQTADRLVSDAGVSGRMDSDTEDGRDG